MSLSFVDVRSMIGDYYLRNVYVKIDCVRDCHSQKFPITLQNNVVVGRWLLIVAFMEIKRKKQNKIMGSHCVFYGMQKCNCIGIVDHPISVFFFFS